MEAWEKLRRRNRDRKSWIIPRIMQIEISILREAEGKERQEEDSVVLPPKPEPLRYAPVEVIL